MTEKQCFKCEETKPLAEFYKHKQMADGHLNKCKSCAKSDVRANREKNVEYYRAYDRRRGARHPPGYTREYRKRFPNKYRAHNIVSYAIKGGKLFPEPCEVCGSEDDVHAHHDDYAKPLNVRWLCAAHHGEWHAKNGPGANQ